MEDKNEEEKMILFNFSQLNNEDTFYRALLRELLRELKKIAFLADASAKALTPPPSSPPSY